MSTMVYAIPTYTGGNGAISFGVAPYGVPVDNGAPTYLNNNFTLRPDILTSPGLGTLGGYLTANPSIANNLSSTGAQPLPLGAFQFGGGNVNGNFGFGSANNLGTTMGYYISDSGPGGGSASYLIDSGITSFTDAAGTPAGTHYGAYLTMGGLVPLVGNADVTALKVHLFSANALSPFNGGGAGVDLPDMVLAISRNGAGNTLANYNIITIGGGAALILDNGTTGAFRSAAVDNLVLGAPIPAGDNITVTATLTAYSDPASIETFDLTTESDLLALTGPLPADLFLGNDVVAPEPGMATLFSASILALCLRRKR